MAIKKIYQLETEQSILTGEELIPVSNVSNQTVKIKLKNLKTLISKSDIGLGNVDNTPDLSKPISTPTQSALNAKANLVHTHDPNDVTGLTLALQGKADTNHGHAIADVAGLSLILDNKSDVGHTHSTADVIGLDLTLAGKSNVGHGHSASDIADLNAAIAAAVTGKSDTGHGHSTEDITGLTTLIDSKILAASPMISFVTEDW